MSKELKRLIEEKKKLLSIRRPTYRENPERHVHHLLLELNIHRAILTETLKKR